MKNILLDTNAYTAILRDQGETVLNAIDYSENIFFSAVVIGELHAGFRGGSRFKRNYNILKEFLSDPAVITADITEETAEIFVEIKNNLKKNGTPIPQNDIWIASQCIEHGAVLITFDGHF